MSTTDTRRRSDERTSTDRAAVLSQSGVAGPTSTKIRREHLDRLAIVYIRQSTPRQVQENRKSKARQYALADFAKALGWPSERVLVIDDDQGQSSQKPTDERFGFQRVVAEVTMDHVGLILGLEMSRLGRRDREWHRLLELCGVFGTLLGDQDGVYDAADPNDRLLLGLKGTISSVELHTMRNRLERESSSRLNVAGCSWRCRSATSSSRRER